VGAGPLTVVLHGGPGAHHDYLLPQYDELAKRRSLFYYDQRGGGRSVAPREAPLGWEAHVQDLDAVRQHLELERVSLCGYSWGGLLALLYLLAHPDRVAHLALVSPASITAAQRQAFEAEFARRMKAPEIQDVREELRASRLADTDPELYRRRMFELSVAPYFRDPRHASQLTPFRVTARTQQAVWDSLGDYDLRARLAHIPHPTPHALVLHGSYDPIPIAGSRELADLLGAPFVELPVGHCPHVEATDDFVRALDAFLPAV
jgi:proline iminopeptidase